MKCVVIVVKRSSCDFSESGYFAAGGVGLQGNPMAKKKTKRKKKRY